MNILTKKCTRLTLAMVAVAMLMGVLFAGCSEGDSDPAHVNYDADSAVLDVVVGLASPTSAKGFDVDSNTVACGVTMLDIDNQIVGLPISYAAEATEDRQAWTVLDDGALLMTQNVAADDISKVASVIVSSVNADGQLLGFLVQENVDLTAGKKNELDFTAEGAPAFMDLEKVMKLVKLNVTTAPESVDEVLTLAAGEKATVTTTAIVELTPNVIYTKELPTKAYTLNSESEHIKIEGNTIEGVSATTEDAIVTVSVIDDVYSVLTDIRVKVTSEEPTSKVTAIKLAPKDAVVTTEAEWDALPTEMTAAIPTDTNDAVMHLCRIAKVESGDKVSYEKLPAGLLAQESTNNHVRIAFDVVTMEDCGDITADAIPGDYAVFTTTYHNSDTPLTASFTIRAK